MNSAVPPAYGKNPSLDSEAFEFPFTKKDIRPHMAPSKKAAGFLVRVESEMGDHPTHSMRLVCLNEATHALNYMFNMRRDIELITCFVVRPDATTPIDHLAHFSWHIIQDVNFKWKSGVPAHELVRKRLDLGDIKLGPPSPLPTVSPPFTNVLSDEALKVILNGKAKPPNLVQATDRDVRIPPDLFT